METVGTSVENILLKHDYGVKLRIIELAISTKSGRLRVAADIDFHVAGRVLEL